MNLIINKMNERELALQQCDVLVIEDGVYDIAPNREDLNL